jgi:glyoxylase-like metal-dependent hydrolase (beta-lactamase superfamily II)
LTEDWTTPGLFELAPGVYRIPLPLPQDGLRAVNVYALALDDDLVLVDSGWAIPQARELLVDALGELGYGAADIRRFLITHVHRDHYTQAVALRREFGNRVSLGAGELRTLQVALDPERPALSDQLNYLQLMGAAELVAVLSKAEHGHGNSNSHVWELPDDWFTDGEIVQAAGRSLSVIPTPGHTNGHVVFHDEANRVLFAGDHVLPTITPSIGFDGGAAKNPLRDFLQSLALVRSRPDAALYPAHGAVTGSVHHRIDELVEHHGARLEETEKAVAAGADTGLAVAGQLGWTRRQRRLDELDTFNQMLAICETGAHLDLLESQGRLIVESMDDVRHYRIS